MKIILSLLTVLLLTFSGFAQDRILTLEGEEILCKVKEIDTSEIRYSLAQTDSVTKKISYNSDLKKIKIAEVFMVSYENGTKDVFAENLAVEKSKQDVKTEPAGMKPAELYALGRQDAELHYDGTTNFVTGALCGAAVIYGGFIPAVVIAAVPPKPKLETTTDPSLLYNPSYNSGFRNKAHGRKALNVAGGFAVGVAADILILILLFGW